MALNLAFESVGSGPPLLVLHGLFGSGANWRSIARRLAATHTVFCVDLRNHGASPWVDSMDYVEMADDVRQLINRLGLQRTAVLGACAAEIRSRVGPAKGRRQGAARGPGWAPGRALQRCMRPFAGPTRRAGAIRGAGRRCTLVACAPHAPRVRLARRRDSPRRGTGFLPRRLLGHSMGGKVAMALALRHPQRVGPLIVVDIAPVAYTDTLTPFAQAMRSVDVRAAASRADVQSRLLRSVPDPRVVPFLMQNLVARHEHFDWRLNLVGIGTAMHQLCGFPSALLGASCPCPLTVIAGRLSEYVPGHDAAAFRPLFDDVTLELIADAGHWVHADQPVAFLHRVQQALHAHAEPAAAGRY